MKQIIKTLCFVVLFVFSFSAYAAMWQLINQEYSPGNGFICTYQLQGTNYTRAVLQQGPCQTYVFN